jgi:hypothetical protein
VNHPNKRLAPVALVLAFMLGVASFGGTKSLVAQGQKQAQSAAIRAEALRLAQASFPSEALALAFAEAVQPDPSDLLENERVAALEESYPGAVDALIAGAAAEKVLQFKTIVESAHGEIADIYAARLSQDAIKKSLLFWESEAAKRLVAALTAGLIGGETSVPGPETPDLDEVRRRRKQETMALLSDAEQRSVDQFEESSAGKSFEAVYANAWLVMNRALRGKVPDADARIEAAMRNSLEAFIAQEGVRRIPAS